MQNGSWTLFLFGLVWWDFRSWNEVFLPKKGASSVGMWRGITPRAEKRLEVASHAAPTLRGQWVVWDHTQQPRALTLSPRGDPASHACVWWTVYTGWAADAPAPWRGPVSQQWSCLGAEGGRSREMDVSGWTQGPRLEACGWREAPEGSGGEPNAGSSPFLMGSRRASLLGQLPLPIPLSASAVSRGSPPPGRAPRAV